MENKINQKYLSETKKKIYIILAVYGLVILFLVFFSIFLFLQGIKKNSEELVAGKNSLVILEEQVGEIERFKSNYELYGPNFEKIDRLYVDQKNPADFFKFLEEETSSHKIKSKVSLSAKSAGGNAQSINFSISTSGDLSNTMNFLKKIETGPYLIKIQNLIMKKETQNNTAEKFDSGIIETDFLIEAYIKQ